MTRWKIGGLTIVLIGVAAITLTLRMGCQLDLSIRQPPPKIDRPVGNADQPRPRNAQAALFGWDAEAAKSELTKRIVAAMPPFGIEGARANETANVRLWEYAEQIGVEPSVYRQQTGDCVSFGGCKNSINILQCVQIALGQRKEFEEVFPCYSYGISRVQIGQRRMGHSAGSCGAWMAKAVSDPRYGVLSADAPGVPEYSGRLADDWGYNGPPEKFISIAKSHIVKATALMRTAADARDAICNGYPVSICSNYGFSVRKSHDRLLGRHDREWRHSMCLIGYDGSEDGRKAGGGEPVYLCWNSWGPNYFQKPLQGEPACSFWLRESDVAGIIAQRDSYAYSGFTGFKAQEIDFHIFGKRKGRRHVSVRNVVLRRVSRDQLSRPCAGLHVFGPAQQGGRGRPNPFWHFRHAGERDRFRVFALPM